MIITIIIYVVIKRGVTSNMRGCCIFGPLTRECAVRPEPARSPTTKLAPPLRRLLSRALTFAEKVRRVVLGLGHLGRVTAESKIMINQAEPVSVVSGYSEKVFGPTVTL